MLEKLKEQLKAIFKDYQTDYMFANDKDISKFENLIIDFDNENNTDYYSTLQEQLRIVDYDIIEDIIKCDCSCIQDIADLVNDIEDNSAEFFKLDDYNCLSNVYVIDLLDFINDYLE